MQTIDRHVIGPDDGETLQLFRLRVRFLVDGEATGGRFSLVEHPLPPRALGAPPHTHAHEDEYSFVLEGRIGVQIGDDVIEARPGELVLKPRGIQHAFWNAGDEPARVLEIISPAGFENYFRELAPLLAAPDENAGALGEVVGRYGLEIDLAGIPAFAARHGLDLT
jgi:quercetin dioxygenase-like cupin family protein